MITVWIATRWLWSKPTWPGLNKEKTIMAYRGDKKWEEIFPPGHPFLEPRIVFGMKPPPNSSVASKPGASSVAPNDPERSGSDHLMAPEEERNR